MNTEQLEKALKQGGHIQFTPGPVPPPPPRVAEIEGCIFDLNAISAIEDPGGNLTWVYLKDVPRALILKLPYEKFKELIGANPVKLEVPDEDR